LIERQALVSYLRDFLNTDIFDDYTINGLQIEGKEKINHIVTGVTSSRALIEKAIKEKADALLVHHGFFWKGESPAISGMKKKRIELLMKHDINLLAYHLPLDCHKTLGNNVQLGSLLELTDLSSVAVGGVPDLLWQGTLNKSHSVVSLSTLLKDTLKQAPLYLPPQHNKPITKIAWCSGGAERYILEAKELGADAYLTGEYSEQTMHLARELDIHFFGCGHHATERYGIKALGNHLSAHFNLPHQFIDISNPV
jgi:dinuclear metal center YbgI/SA1388 family protein